MVFKKESKLILDYFKGDDTYSDGSVEGDILRIFKEDGSGKKVSEILKNEPNWPMRYHLSSVRNNLLSWYDFSKNGTLLEVGAGCGALTGLFCDKLKGVTAIELSKRRAEIIARRHSDKSNLTVYAGNFNDIKLTENFDYVTSIGVLEYAGKYTHTNDPFGDFILELKKYLKKGGTLIIAIENKFGLKYWSGAREDHTGAFFDSIQGYPRKGGIKTFGKKEIKDLLVDSGFKHIDFFYPFPDYKLPTEIFSDRYQPSSKHGISPTHFPFTDHSNDREYLFDEYLVMKELIKNGQFDFFSNSFLIFATL